VVVIGGAVMDVTFKTTDLPARETSREAYAFDLSPGGKGLMQAVAAARLGLEVSLLAAVTDDRFGREIVDYLRRENVDTSLIKVVGDASTPFTGIIEFELGDSIALNWRNDREVRLDARDVDGALPRLAEADVVLMTFEIPRESLLRAIARISEVSGRRPILIVTPGQPYTDGGVTGQALARIDYLVAHPWELGRYAPTDGAGFEMDPVARRLLAYGVQTLCVLIGGGCTVYSDTALGTFSVPTFQSVYKESSAARDAFCAALAAKLIDQHGEFSEGVALWATVAMAAAAADHPLPNPMPDRARVDQFLRRSRFTVAPRDGAPPVTAPISDG
jgi:ribokinase